MSNFCLLLFQNSNWNFAHVFYLFKKFGSYYFALGTPNGSIVESRVGVEGYFTEASAMAASVVAGSSTTLNIEAEEMCSIVMAELAVGDIIASSSVMEFF